MMMKKGEVRLGEKAEAVLKMLFNHKWMTAKAVGRFSGVKFTSSIMETLLEHGMVAKAGEAYTVTKQGMDYLEEHDLITPIHVPPIDLTQG